MHINNNDYFYVEIIKSLTKCLLIIFGIRFFFYSDDHEPIHVHIAYGGKLAKIQVLPEIKAVYDQGVGPQILKKALKTVENYQDDIIAEWHSYFDK